MSQPASAKIASCICEWRKYASNMEAASNIVARSQRSSVAQNHSPTARSRRSSIGDHQARTNVVMGCNAGRDRIAANIRTQAAGKMKRPFWIRIWTTGKSSTVTFSRWHREMEKAWCFATEPNCPMRQCGSRRTCFDNRDHRQQEGAKMPVILTFFEKVDALQCAKMQRMAGKREQ